METNKEKEWFRQITLNQSGKTNPIKASHNTTDTKIKEQRNLKPNKHGFTDIAGMDQLKQLVTESFINILNNRECAAAFGITPPSILLYGPSGCGKTFFAEAIANEVGINFIKVIPDDIASKWLHGTQEKICEIFQKAERQSPTILFFDEFDAMVPRRSEDDQHNQNGEVNEFLCMLNNASTKGIYIIAATNHPECIDKAILRTERIDEMIYVDMPDKAARESLFRLSLSNRPTAENIDYAKLADLTNGYNCSDISYIVKLASRKMFNASIAEKDKPYKVISQEQLEEAISNKQPSVSNRDLREYERIRQEFSPKNTAIQIPIVGFR